MALVELENVEKTYSTKLRSVKAIRGISLNIEDGEFVVVLGKSGSGKSTLLSLLTGLERPTNGAVRFNGRDLGTLSEDELALFRRKEVGIVFQHFFLMEAMTALDNVQLPLIISGTIRNEREARAEELLKIVGMGHRMSHFPNELSGGERQRVGIARALSNRASVIIADEPTGDLDSEKGKEIIDLLYSLNKRQMQEDEQIDEDEQLDEDEPMHDNKDQWNPTVILVTHDVRLLKPGMRVVMLSDGRIVRDLLFDGDTSGLDPLASVSSNSSLNL